MTSGSESQLDGGYCGRLSVINYMQRQALGRVRSYDGSYQGSLSNMSSGRLSILSSDKVSARSSSSQVKASQKVATLNPLEKEVTLLTPVLIGNSNFPSTIDKRKVKYLLGSHLHAKVVPENIGELEDGVLIDMPVNGVRSYLESIINLESLLPDEVLVQYLKDLLEESKASKQKVLTRMEKLAASIVESELFTKMPEHVQANIKRSLEADIRKEGQLKHKKVLLDSRKIKAMYDDHDDKVQENLRRVYGPEVGADSDDERALMERDPWLYNQIQKSTHILKKR